MFVLMLLDNQGCLAFLPGFGLNVITHQGIQGSALLIRHLGKLERHRQQIRIPDAALQGALG